MFSSRPVRAEEPSPPDSVSGGGSAGVSTPREESFLGHDSTETPWSAVSPGSEDRNSSTFCTLASFISFQFIHHISFHLSFLLLRLQVQVWTVPLSVVWLCPSSSLVLLTLLSSDPPLADLRPPVSPSSSLSGTSCRRRQIRPPSCLAWSKSSTVCSPRWAGLCRLCLAPPPVASRRTCSEGSS